MNPQAEHHWEDRYRSKPRFWSGKPNPALVKAIADLTPGRALDLGCGEGADSLWMAEQGWNVTAADVSAVALSRGAAEATRRRIPSAHISWIRTDLSAWEPQGGFDFVASSYFHLPSLLSRYSLLRRFSQLVEPGGFFFVLSHATFGDRRNLPERLRGLDHPPEVELRRFRLEPDCWQVLQCARVPRRLDAAEVAQDNLVLLRRLSVVA